MEQILHKMLKSTLITTDSQRRVHMLQTKNSDSNVATNNTNNLVKYK